MSATLYRLKTGTQQRLVPVGEILEKEAMKWSDVFG
jgi:hypothetical protein